MLNEDSGIDNVHRLTLCFRRRLPCVRGYFEEGYRHNLGVFASRTIAFDDTLPPYVSGLIQKVHNKLKLSFPRLCIVSFTFLARNQTEFEKDVRARAK